MSENMDEGNENDFKENDNANQENEILRKNQPFIEYFKQVAKLLQEQGKKVDRIKILKCFKNLSAEEKAKYKIVGSDIAHNNDKEDEFVKGTKKAIELDVLQIILQNWLQNCQRMRKKKKLLSNWDLKVFCT